MGEFLSGLGYMSLQAGCVVLVVLIVRLLFGKLKVPKKYVMLLWLVPYLCMVCPWKVESAFGFWRQPQEYQLERINHVLQNVEHIVGNHAGESGLPDSDKVVEGWQVTEFSEDLASGVQVDESMQNTSHIGAVVLGDAGSPVAVVGLGGAAKSSVLDSFQGAGTVAVVVFGVWLSGVLGIWIYSVISYVQLKKKLICSVNLRDNIYIADDIQMPFVLGLVCPKIYLPGGMNKENQLYVLAHESTHIRRRDTIRKLAALVITAIHWFNPLAWVAWHFMEKDMEMACDEETLQRLGLEQKQAYATALLQLSAGRRFALGAPLAFGEGNVKSRIQNIVKYKKTLGVVSAMAVILVTVLAVVFMSSSSTCPLEEVEEEWSVFHATDDRVSVVMNGERTEFPQDYCAEFNEFFLELLVARNPISKSREEDRVKDIVIAFDEERFYYLSEDCTEIWSDNRVKPGYSYRIQNPQEVKDFLERMLGSVTEAEVKESGAGEDRSQNGQEETVNTGQGTAATVENADAQLAVIVKERELWMHKFSDDTYFMVTDLDRNGRLELIRSFMEGTGRYTRTNMYEITEDGTGLKEVIIDFARDDSGPDIIEDGAAVYEDEAGVFYYVFQDYIRGGYSEHQYYKYAVKLEKGKLESEVLAEHYEFWNETETISTYKNASGEAITEEEYIKVAEKRFAGLNRYQAVFGWQEMTEYEKDGEEDLLKALEDSWGSFQLSAEGTGSSVNLPKGAVQVAITKPFMTEDTLEGVAGVFMDFASEDRIIFHDYYGLFVYDRKKGLTGEIDLKAIGMEMIQGSNAWNVQVTADGSRLYMHGMEEEDMYVYDVEQNKLYLCEKYDVGGADLFSGLVNTGDCVEPDYTVSRSYHCVVLENGDCHYLESGSGMPIDLCWIIDSKQGKAVSEREYIKIFMEEDWPEYLPVPSARLPALTMEDLIALCKEEMVGKTLRNYVEKDGFIPENFKRNYQEEALTWNYECPLAYAGKEYTLRATYWNPLVAQEYGHAPDQLNTVMLYENGSGDGLMLYSIDAGNASVPIMDIEDFLAKEYDLGRYMSFELPEGTRSGKYMIGMNDCFEGCLVQGDFEEIPHGDWAPDAWYVPGGIGVAGKEVLEERATFEDGQLSEFHWLHNHMWGEKVEVLENCELPAVLYHYEFDVFTLPELDEYARDNNMTIEQVKSVSDYWYVFFAEPDGEYVYTVFLNQAYFDKEDIVKLAESVHFLE